MEGRMKPSPLVVIDLRNTYRVYREPSGAYVVESEAGHGALHAQRVSAGASDWLGRRLAGGIVTRQEAAEILEPVADELGLPYSYGHKLGYYAQDILLTLVAEERATIEKVGRGYNYRVVG
jgi:hypothetical protein